MSDKEFASVIARVLDDKQGKDITILNISSVSSLADYFVIASGESTTQVRALMNTTRERIKEIFGRLPVRMENDLKNRWNLLDYGDIVVHILHKEERDAYALEKFWSNSFSIPEEEWKQLSEEHATYLQKTE